MMLQPHSQLAGIQAFNALPPHRGKRKADGPDNNERLSKRLSLLNLGTFFSFLSPFSFFTPR